MSSKPLLTNNPNNLCWLLGLLLLIFAPLCQGEPTQWQQVAPGLDYAVLTPKNFGKLYAFRISPKQYRLDLVLAKDHQQDSSFVKQLATLNNGIIAVNGGFFTPNHEPLGLRIKDGKVRSPLKPISWWGVFYIRNNKPHIVAMKNYRGNKHITFAVQAGPRLLINGHVPKLKEGAHNRSALCITKNKQIILLATQDLSLSTTDLADIIKQPESAGGLGCYNALNLDGGHSTQLYAKVGSLNLNVPNFSSVTDAVVVLPRQ